MTMDKLKLVWESLKGQMPIRTNLGKTFPVIGISFFITVLFFIFTCRILDQIKYFKSFHDWINAFVILMLYNILFLSPTPFLRKKYRNTLLYKYGVLAFTIIVFCWLTQTLFAAFLYIRFNPLVEYRQLLATIHIPLGIFWFLLFLIPFMRSQKESRKLFYERKFGVILVNPSTILQDEIPRNFAINLVFIPMFPYCFVIAILMFAKGFIYGTIAMTTAFTLASVILALIILQSLYKLFVVLPEVKRTTGSEVYADVYNYLGNDPERLEKFFADLHANS